MSRQTVSVPLRWADMDAYGHVNNANQIRLMEEARVAGFGVPGGTGSPVGREGKVDLFENVGDGLMILVVEHTIRYLAQLPYRDVPAAVDIWISDIKPATFTVNYEIRDGHDGTLCSRASTRLALADGETGRLTRIPADVREAMQAFTDDSRETE